MTDPEHERKKKRKEQEQEMAAMDTFMRDHAVDSAKREERQIEVLEQISSQLDTIEELLRTKLGKNNGG